jgi:phage terminase small subunit
LKGRKPLPTALKVLRGNAGHRAKEDLGRGEPDPEVMLGVPPASIADDPVAVAYWFKEGGQLLKTRVITASDHDAFCRLCDYHSRREYQDAIIKRLQRKKKLTVADVAMLGMANNQLIKFDDRMEKMRLEFGMTPASRTRVKIDTGQLALPLGATDDNPFDRAMQLARGT